MTFLELEERLRKLQADNAREVEERRLRQLEEKTKKQQDLLGRAREIERRQAAQRAVSEHRRAERESTRAQEEKRRQEVKSLAILEADAKLAARRQQREQLESALRERVQASAGERPLSARGDRPLSAARPPSAGRNSRPPSAGAAGRCPASAAKAAQRPSSATNRRLPMAEVLRPATAAAGTPRADGVPEGPAPPSTRTPRVAADSPRPPKISRNVPTGPPLAPHHTDRGAAPVK
eukprot:gnl/TRDRNA2_/TRDRNA2_161708_c5_seq1.p1 gnl/TRDRNA2_/TRDRNA2_161708_c5~~gnl/TRDRNA2_/TRDRNA2_161708_c5_seq1.p1  ORF type:complete len:236 (-),score=40.16 gnl/TRDRNA2_/TRDRNA2_161708_c5_seq1:17-724(-)